MGKNDIDAMIDIIPVDPLSDRVQGSSRGRKRTRLMILEYRNKVENMRRGLRIYERGLRFAAAASTKL